MLRYLEKHAPCRFMAMWDDKLSIRKCIYVHHVDVPCVCDKVSRVQSVQAVGKLTSLIIIMIIHNDSYYLIIKRGSCFLVSSSLSLSTFWFKVQDWKSQTICRLTSYISTWHTVCTVKWHWCRISFNLYRYLMQLFK